MSGYTKEPWELVNRKPGDKQRIYAAGEMIASTWYPRKMPEEMLAGESWLDMRQRTKPDRDAIEMEAFANARRIVACVNACAGIPTETLEIWEPSDKESFGAVYARAEKAEARLAEAEHAVRTIELCVDGLNTKGYPQKKNTQAALDNIKRHCRAFLESKP